MAYTAVPTVTTGDYWTAANHNTYIRDNFAASIPDLFTTAGDMVRATAADTATKLPIGGAGSLLVSTGTAPAWDPAVGCSLTRNTALSIPHASWTTITWDVENYDTNSFHGTGSPGRITIPAGMGGHYWIYCVVVWAGNTTANRYAELRLNGAAIARADYKGDAAGPSITLGKTAALAAADYLQVTVYQDSGAPLNVNSTGGTPFFGIDLVL